MESISVLEMDRLLEEKGLSFVDYATLGILSKHDKANTLYKLADRLVDSGVLERLGGGGQFVVKRAAPNDFEVANYLYAPAYVSLESALSFYGILPQFVYSVTSVTTRKSLKRVWRDKEYVFSHIDEELFWGYEKLERVLVATKEKALVDALYFMSKGLVRLDIEELDLSSVDKNVLAEYAGKVSYAPFKMLWKELAL